MDAVLYHSPVGRLLINGDEKGIQEIIFEEKFREPVPEHSNHMLVLASEWLDLYFSGRKPEFTVPVNLQVTPYTCKVLREIGKIPYGETVTYGELAEKLNSSARAVGGAAGRNPVPLIIPCHRVIGSRGKLTGYGGGKERKKKLLEIEGIRFRTE